MKHDRVPSQVPFTSDIFFLKVLNMKVKGKCPRGKMRSRWEQQVRKDVTQREGNEEELWEDRDRWRGLTVR
jgi:hypothetical protein